MDLNSNGSFQLNLQANRHFYDITCSDINHYAAMKSLFTILCPTDFELVSLCPSRMKGVYKGRCLWGAHYRILNGSVAGKINFKNAVNMLTTRIPFGSKVVSIGRSGGPIYGVAIQLGNKNCTCVADFSCGSTLFHVLKELRFEAYSNNWLIYQDEMSVDACAEEIFGLSNKFGHSVDGSFVTVGVFLFVVQDEYDGLMDDDSIDFERALVECRCHLFSHNEKMTVESYVQVICRLSNTFGGSPFCLAILFPGADCCDLKLWHMDSSCSYLQYADEGVANI